MTLAALQTQLEIVTGTSVEAVYFEWDRVFDENRRKSFPCVLWEIDGASYNKDVRDITTQKEKILTLNIFIIGQWVGSVDKLTLWDQLEEHLDDYLNLVNANSSIQVLNIDKLKGIYVSESTVKGDVALGVKYESIQLEIISCIPSPDAPVIAIGASNIEWNAVTGATGYYLDIAPNKSFTTFIAGYQNKDIGDVLSVTPLSEGFLYYRIRAYGDRSMYNPAVSENSNIVSCSKWFLPSKDELTAMYTELAAYGIGGFIIDGAFNDYWSSTETDTKAYQISMLDGFPGQYDKTVPEQIRACRTFTAGIGAYSLRDVGPAGGWIFHIDGTTYYEAAQGNVSESQIWSNITASAGATGSTIGTGQANTMTIIGQAGHTDSAAKLCNDLVI